MYDTAGGAILLKCRIFELVLAAALLVEAAELVQEVAFEQLVFFVQYHVERVPVDFSLMPVLLI